MCVWYGWAGGDQWDKGDKGDLWIIIHLLCMGVCVCMFVNPFFWVTLENKGDKGVPTYVLYIMCGGVCMCVSGGRRGVWVFDQVNMGNPMSSMYYVCICVCACVCVFCVL